MFNHVSYEKILELYYGLALDWHMHECGFKPCETQN